MPLIDRPSYCERPGKGCEAQPFYSLKLNRPASISRIELHAEDEVGLTRQAELVVKLNGRQLGTFPVNWTGSMITIPVNRTGQRVTIESRDPRGIRFGGRRQSSPRFTSSVANSSEVNLGQRMRYLQLKDLATGPALRCDQSGCKSACCLPHLVHLSRRFTAISFVVSPPPCAASSSNVIAL